MTDRAREAICELSPFMAHTMNDLEASTSTAVRPAKGAKRSADQQSQAVEGVQTQTVEMRLMLERLLLAHRAGGGAGSLSTAIHPSGGGFCGGWGCRIYRALSATSLAGYSS